MWNTFTHNLNICVWVCFWCPKLKMRKNIVMAHSYEFFSALLTCGGEAGDRSSSALPLGHRDVCGPPAWSILAKFFYLPYLGCFQLHLESCIRVHSYEDCGGVLSAYPREIRNREGAAQRRSSPILLSRSYFSRENPPPLFRSSSSSSSSFFRKRFRGFVRVGDRPNSVRVGAVAEPTSHSLQYRSTSGTPDGSRSTVLQTQFFSRRLRRRTHSKNDQSGSK